MICCNLWKIFKNCNVRLCFKKGIDMISQIYLVFYCNDLKVGNGFMPSIPHVKLYVGNGFMPSIPHVKLHVWNGGYKSIPYVKLSNYYNAKCVEWGA